VGNKVVMPIGLGNDPCPQTTPSDSGCTVKLEPLSTIIPSALALTITCNGKGWFSLVSAAYQCLCIMEPFTHMPGCLLTASLVML